MGQPVIPTLTAADQALAVSTLVNNSIGRWNATRPKGTAVTVQYSFGTNVSTYVGQCTETRTAKATFQQLDAETKVSEGEAFNTQTNKAGGSG